MAASRRGVRVRFFGRLDYGTAVALQHRLRDEVLAARAPEQLLLLEHPHVFTLGRNASHEHVLADERWQREHGVEVWETDRGGQVTYHGPGQLVGYPILDLKPDRRDVRRYVRDLEEVLVRTLAELGIAAEPGLGDRPVGVWVGGRKIASIGVHLRQWVTTHGFALNVATDLAYFGGVVACGLPGAPMTSVRELGGRAPSLERVAELLVPHFCDVFGCEPLGGTIESVAAEARERLDAEVGEPA